MLLCFLDVAIADLVHNRRERGSPSVFQPRRYFPLLCDAIFAAFSDWSAANNPPNEVQVRSVVFRMLSEKIIRVGQVDALVQSWLRAIEDSRRSGSRSEIVLHQILLRSLPESCYQQFFQQLAKEPGHDTVRKVAPGSSLVLNEPKYALLSYLPPDMAASQQFVYVLAHKLLLKAPIGDLFVWRVLVDALIQSQARLQAENQASGPLMSLFDVVLGQWSQSDFPVSTDYALNASVCFFLRYTMLKMIKSHADAFASRGWTAKLCKGVQDHMSHSVERVRLLGMRVGETLSTLLSPENPLNFEIAEVDPLDVYGRAEVTIGLLPSEETPSDRGSVNGSRDGQSGDDIQPAFSKTKKKKSKHRPTAFTLDPDAVVLSDDDDDISDDQGGESKADNSGDSDAESDSDMSLAAYDLEDDERDLQAARPVYLKDLISALLAEDNREKAEAALKEAEHLLRRRPRDLHENVREVVTTLVRLEDKYSTTNFVTLRSNALAAACALSPVKTLPYFLSQALEREQLLQSRIDILQAMVRASQELSETGDFRVSGPKTLLRSSTATTGTSDLNARTMASLKTRRFGYRRDPLVAAKKNAFSEHALAFFSPLLFGYVEYRRQIQASSSSPGSGLSEVEHVFLAHLLHALACFVEAAGNAPQAVSMAKCLVEFAWVERDNKDAAVRRQVLFCVSRVLLVVPPFLLRQELGESIVEVLTWMQQVARADPDDGCREASRLLLSSSSIPILSLH